MECRRRSYDLAILAGAAIGTGALYAPDVLEDESSLVKFGRHLSPIQAGALGEGSLCGGDAVGALSCADDLACRCFIRNRGLHLCLPLRWPFAENALGEGLATKWERQGLVCDPRLPDGAAPMKEAPPLVDTGGQLVDPRSTEFTSTALGVWASESGPGRGFYSRYVAVLSEADPQVGVAVLAGDDVTAGMVVRHAGTIRHLLFESAVSIGTAAALASANIRVLIGGDNEGAVFSSWTRHPEVSTNFLTGLGGGAPWFPSMGITSNEPAKVLAEELFHTIQYTAMSPRQVCSYHNAYAAAVTSGLYTTDNSGEEVDGEPVPTLQADEYLAMAMQRWFGDIDPPGEYGIPGNNADGTGRQHLRAGDPSAFCLLSEVFRSDDSWNPEPLAAPWDRYPNQPIDPNQVASECAPVLASLATGCPAEDVAFDV